MSLMRINDLFHFEKGSLQSSKCTEGNFDFITASSEWKTHNEYTHDCEALVFAAAASGSLGRTHYVNGKFVSSDLCFIITAKDPKKFPIDLKFYHMIFNEFKNDIVNSTKAGTSKEAIGMKAFGNYKLPYFNIDKQIETKIQFVNMQHSKVELNSELTNQLDLIKQLRKAFLREAMQGKLVKSINTEETGQQLLEKIKVEKSQLITEKKLKKEKELSPISDVDIPFDIPKTWSWCRFQDITKVITCGLASTPIYKKEGKKFLSAKNIKPFRFMPEDFKYVDEETYNKVTKNAKPEVNDILITRVGAGIGETALIDKEIDFAYYVSLTLVKPFNKINSNYLVYWLNSPTGIQSAISFTTGTGSSQGNLNVEKVRTFLIPIPPLHEQEQIVAKLEELMAFCDGLEQSIKESQGYNEMLLQQVLREALQGKEEINLI